MEGIVSMKKTIVCMLACLTLLIAAGCKSPEEITQNPPEQRTSQEIVLKQETQEEQRTLSVSGNGEVDVKPDVATVRLSVFVQAKTAEEAQTQNSEKMTAVLDVIKSMGVQEKDIQTQDISVYPVQDYEKNPPAITGYAATNTITVEIYDMDKTGELITAATQAGVNEVLSVDFKLQDESKFYQQALQSAVADAQEKAQAMADAAGVELDGPLDMQESGSVSAPQYMMEAPAADKAEESVNTPVQSGEITVAAQVSIVYKLKIPATPKPVQP